jgi:ATP-binding cassette subfamily B protein
MRWFITRGLNYPVKSQNTIWLVIVVLGIATAMGLCWFFARFAEWCTNVARLRASHRVMRELLNWAQTVDLSVFEDSRNHDFIDRVKQDLANEIGNGIASLTRIVAALIGLISLFILIGPIAPLIITVLTLGAFAIVALETQFGLSQYYLRWALTEGERRARSLKGLFLTQSSARDIRIFRIDGWLIDQWKHWALLGARARGIQLAKHTTAHLLQLIEVALTTGAIFYGINRFNHHLINLQQLGFMIVSIQPLVGYAFSIAHESQTLIQVWILIKDVGKLLEMRNSSEKIPEEPPLPSTSDLQRDILVTCKNVTFTYPGAFSPALHNINLNIKRNERIAIVGPNGAGKSTLAFLLLGIFAPNTGSIQWIGNNQKFRVVMQNFNRYHLSLAANVGVGALGEGKVSRRMLEKAAEASELTQVINQLPSKWLTRLSGGLGDGFELSGGEWQRVALARAFCRSSDLWLVDEPAASLDPLAEREIHLRLHKMSSDDAVIIISHRLSMLGMVDRVIVLDNGRIVEDGTLNDLLSNSESKFFNLYESQAKWYH